MNQSTLTLTVACELTHIFQTMDLGTLEMYAANLKQRMNECAINYIEGGPIVEKDTYLEMKEIYSKVQTSLENKKIHVL
jgi:hypothetical protein